MHENKKYSSKTFFYMILPCENMSFYTKSNLGEDVDNNVETLTDSIAANEVVDFDESAKQTIDRDNNMNVS